MYYLRSMFIIYIKCVLVLSLPTDCSDPVTVSLEAMDQSTNEVYKPDQVLRRDVEDEESTTEVDIHGFIDRESMQVYSPENIYPSPLYSVWLEPFYTSKGLNRQLKRSNDHVDPQGQAVNYDLTSKPQQTRYSRINAAAYPYYMGPVYPPYQYDNLPGHGLKDGKNIRNLRPRSIDDDIMAQLLQEAMMNNILPTMPIPFVRNVGNPQYQYQVPVTVNDDLYNSVSDACGVPILLTCSPQILYRTSGQNSAFKDPPVE